MLDWIVVDGMRIGVVATRPGKIEFLQALAQRLLERREKNELQIGTIHQLNHASRRTTEGAGLKAVLTYAFVPIA